MTGDDQICDPALAKKQTSAPAPQHWILVYLLYRYRKVGKSFHLTGCTVYVSRVLPGLKLELYTYRTLWQNIICLCVWTCSIKLLDAACRKALLSVMEKKSDLEKQVKTLRYCIVHLLYYNITVYLDPVTRLHFQFWKNSWII